MGKVTTSAKVYLRDAGLLHTLLALEASEDVAGHPKPGASFEGLVVEQLAATFGTGALYFWATYGGAELDVLLMRGGRSYGFECRFSDAPGNTRSMRTALDDLDLAHLRVIYPGDDACPLDDRISVLQITRIPALTVSLGTGGERTAETSTASASVTGVASIAVCGNGSSVFRRRTWHRGRRTRQASAAGTAGHAGRASGRPPRQGPRAPSACRLKPAPARPACRSGNAGPAGREAARCRCPIRVFSRH